MPRHDPSRENQGDLFESTGASRREGAPPRTGRTRNPLRLSCSLEQAVAASIVAIVLAVVVFMLGVGRGRAIERAESAALAAASLPVFEPAPPAPPAAPPAAPAAAAPARAPAPPEPAAAPAAAPPAAPSPRVARDPKKPYTIQLVAYRSEDRAFREVNQLRAKGYDPTLVTKGGYYQVCVGQYRDLADAQKDLRALRKRYRDCYLRKI